MKIKEIKINNFKRFTDLHIKNIPETVKLVVLVGPNGSGKTSLFEAMNHWYKFKGFNSRGEQHYIHKASDGILNMLDSDAWWSASSKKVDIEFHGAPTLNKEQVKSKFYFRTAYRNEPDFTISNLKKMTSPIESLKLDNLMMNDQTVSENYQRLIAQTLSGVYSSQNNSKTVAELREELIGKIKNSLSNIFTDLQLSSIGDPLENGSFYFEKGTSKDFHYKNLSAGEKSVFDLILDILIKADYYPNAVFCIDEPEAHMHTRLQSKVLRELYNLTPENSQLWISTHSIGMLKEAETIEKESPGSVAFLDFDNRNYDETEIMEPTKIGQAIWERFFDLAFADFSNLIAPARIVFCEGSNQGRSYKNFDAMIYGEIFKDEFYDAVFVSIGSCTELEDVGNKSMSVVSNILSSSETIKFIDRDDRSENQIKELLQEKNIKTSKRRNIESYLVDDELIKKLCVVNEKEELIEQCLEAKKNALSESVARGNPDDDYKSASGKIFTELKKILQLTQCGNNKCSFFRDTITPLITPDTDVYRELKEELFG